MTSARPYATPTPGITLPGGLGLPAAVRAEVTHQRLHPFRYWFAHRTTQWLVDLADHDLGLPRGLRWLGNVRARDHFDADDDRPLLAKVHSVLTDHATGWSGERVLALTGARSFGHAFDPLTTYFCFTADGALEGVLAEVHNTYGQWHAYPLAVAPTRESAARAGTEKAFYVSPFFTVDGDYAIEVRLDAESVAVRITLTQDGEVVFTGAVRGRPVPAPRRRTRLRRLLTDPASSRRVALLIRLHGVRLWLRRLPVVPRPAPTPKGTR
ncbi:MAG: DUF1365 domain-containing protein [Nocardioides sp.]|nr:DUF1365 domain-containing protein [Nocardioides sp.]